MRTSITVKNFKIIHIIHSLAPGGAENLVRVLAQEQVRKGHDIDVVTVGPPIDLASDSYAAQFKQELGQAGIGWKQVNLPKTASAAFAQLRRQLDFGPLTVVHCHLFRGLPALLSLPRRATRVVYTHHNSSYPVPPRMLYWVANRTVDAFVSVCSNTNSDARAYFKGSSRLIHNGIALSRYRKRASQQPLHRPVRLVNIGSFTPQKNHRRAVEMMAQLGPDYQLTVFGAGALETEIRQAARDLGVDTISLAGVSCTLADELARHDLMVQTSDWEGMPLSLIEGHAAGLPIVATDVGDTVAIVADGITGYLVSKDATASQLADKIRQTVTLDNYATFSESARKCVVQFDIEKTAEKYSTLYEDIAVSTNARHGTRDRQN